MGNRPPGFPRERPRSSWFALRMMSSYHQAIYALAAGAAAQHPRAEAGALPSSIPTLLPDFFQKQVLPMVDAQQTCFSSEKKCPVLMGGIFRASSHHRNVGTFWLHMPNFPFQTLDFTSFFFPPVKHLQTLV